MRYLIVLLSVLAVTSCAGNPARITGGHLDGFARMKRTLDDQMPRLLEQRDLASLVVVVLDDQRIVHAGAYGLADVDSDTPATLDTVYRIGSISKLFTATAILQLQERALLDIDEPLHHYLPGFSMGSDAQREKITLRAMLSHQSGLPSDRHGGFLRYDAAHSLIEDLADEPLAFEPGTVHAYSNLAYGLLGQVIERVSGLDYGSYLHQHVFEPLALHSASLGNDAVSGFASAYENGKRREPVEIRDRAAGDIRMSAADLARFAKAMLRLADGDAAPHESDLLSRDSVEMMWQVQGSRSLLDSGFDVGLGWMLSYPSQALQNEQDIVWHNGSTFYYNSALLMSTREKLAVIVLGNSAEQGRPSSDEVAESTLLAAMSSKSGYQPVPQEASTARREALTREQIDVMSGRYLSNVFGDVRIEQDDDRFSLRLNGQKAFLVPMKDGSYALRIRLLGFIPYSNETIRQLRFVPIMHQGRTLLRLRNGPVVAQKVEAQTLPAHVSPWMGEYVLDDDDGIATLLGFSSLRLSDVGGYIKGELAVRGETQTLFFDVMDESRVRLLGYGRSQGDSAYYREREDGRRVIDYSGLRFVQKNPS